MRGRAARVLLPVLVAGALVLTLAGCSVEVVDDAASPGPAPSGSRSAASSDPHGGPGPSGGGATDGSTDGGGAQGRPDAEGATGEAGVPGLPTRDDLRLLTTGQTACGGADLTRDRAGDAVEVTDACRTLTVAGADSVVVAGDVEHLVVAGAGARVAVRSVTTVTLAAAAVTVTWEDGNPVVTDGGPGSTYGAVGAG